MSWRFELIEHPPYCPYLAPSNFHVFGPVKEALRGRIFSSDEEAIGAVQNWLKMQLLPPPQKKLVKRWNRCIEVVGNYIEK
jgi:hypothetical protein